MKRVLGDLVSTRLFEDLSTPRLFWGMNPKECHINYLQEFQGTNHSHLGSAISAECFTRPQYVLRSCWDAGSSLLPGKDADMLNSLRRLSIALESFPLSSSRQLSMARCCFAIVVFVRRQRDSSSETGGSPGGEAKEPGLGTDCGAESFVRTQLHLSTLSTTASTRTIAAREDYPTASKCACSSLLFR